MTCPVCQSREKVFLFTAFDILYQVVTDKFTVYKCQICDAIYIHPFPTQEETARFYPTDYYSYSVSESEGFFERLKKKIIKSKLEGNSKMSLVDRLLVVVFQNKFSGIPLYRKNGGKFLDIGCGSGANLKILQAYGWDTYGIELDRNAVEYAKKQGLKVEQSSLESAQFGNQKFDSIRIWHVFEHLTNPHGAIEKMKELLSVDGEILMALPNTQSWARMMFGRYWYNLDVPRHVISYSPKTLHSVMKMHGLKITEIKYVSCGAFLGSISNFLKFEFGFGVNLINNIFLIFLFYPIDFLSDIFKGGDVIFLKIKKDN